MPSSFPLQAECLPTARTPAACWECVAGLWSSNLSCNSRLRLTLCEFSTSVTSEHQPELFHVLSTVTNLINKKKQKTELFQSNVKFTVCLHGNNAPFNLISSKMIVFIHSFYISTVAKVLCDSPNAHCTADFVFKNEFMEFSRIQRSSSFRVTPVSRFLGVFIC